MEGFLCFLVATWCGPGTDARPTLTPAIRADFAAAGFTELAFEAPEGSGHDDRSSPPWMGRRLPFDPDQQLFDFVGDGWNPV